MNSSSHEIEDDGANEESMLDYLWDGPENSDEEIEEMAALKNQYEKEIGIVFSKNGLISYIDCLMKNEKTDKKW